MTAPRFVAVPVYRERFQSHPDGGGGLVERDPVEEVLAVAQIVRWAPAHAGAVTVVHLADGGKVRAKMTPSAFEALVQRANLGAAVLRSGSSLGAPPTAGNRSLCLLDHDHSAGCPGYPG